LIVTTPGLGESISGAILYDDTIRQRKKDGTPFGRWRFHLPAPSSNRALDIWKGQKDKIGAAQKILYHRAKCNSMARRGEYAQG
jgi:fructose-bisphosphate aldolase class 1